MIRSSRGRRAFTIMELLVVMAIIAVLIALLAPALNGVRKRGYKQVEMNNLKHLGHAWMLYANANSDAALPGFLERRVQEEPVPGVSNGWSVTYKYPDRSVIPLDNQNLTGPWTWRLLSYLDFDHQLIHAHLNEDNVHPGTLAAEGKRAAYEPAFGYNGRYIGGWWDMISYSGVLTPRFKFFDHCDAQAPGRRLHIPTGVAQIARASDMVTFCASANFPSPGVKTRLPADHPGWHIVEAPNVANLPRWKPAQSDPIGSVQALQPNVCAPIARHTGSIAVLYADGHVAQEGYNALFDQRKWISSADSSSYTHKACQSQ